MFGSNEGSLSQRHLGRQLVKHDFFLLVHFVGKQMLHIARQSQVWLDAIRDACRHNGSQSELSGSLLDFETSSFVETGCFDIAFEVISLHGSMV